MLETNVNIEGPFTISPPLCFLFASTHRALSVTRCEAGRIPHLRPTRYHGSAQEVDQWHQSRQALWKHPNQEDGTPQPVEMRQLEEIDQGAPVKDAPEADHGKRDSCDKEWIRGSRPVSIPRFRELVFGQILNQFLDQLDRQPGIVAG